MRTIPIILFSIIWLFLTSSVSIMQEKEINKTYEKKETVNIKAVLGNCRVIKSSDGKIHVKLIYTYDDDLFRPVFTESESRLNIEEKFKVKNPSGRSDWTIAVPEDIKLKFSSGTGSFSEEGIKLKCEAATGTGSVAINKGRGTFNISSGTGSITVKNVTGEFKVSAGTGSIRFNKSDGTFDITSGTGSQNISGIIINGSSKFSSGTGNVNVSLAESPDKDVSVASGTGNAILNYNGNPLKGYFEFKAKTGHGNIESPVKFENEETVQEGHSQYDKKSFHINNQNSPLISIQSGTGSAELIK